MSYRQGSKIYKFNPPATFEGPLHVIHLIFFYISDVEYKVFISCELRNIYKESLSPPHSLSLYRIIYVTDILGSQKKMSTPF